MSNNSNNMVIIMDSIGMFRLGKGEKCKDTFMLMTVMKMMSKKKKKLIIKGESFNNNNNNNNNNNKKNKNKNKNNLSNMVNCQRIYNLKSF